MNESAQGGSMGNRRGTITVLGSEVEWTVSFTDDLEKIYTEELRGRGYHPKPGTKVGVLARLLHQWKAHRLEHLLGRRMKVRYSREISSQERFAAIKEITSRVRRGQPLWPYTSKLTRGPRFNDMLQNQWGITHLHLGDSLGSDGYVSRTEKLLFVYPTEGTFYVLGVFGHAFTDADALNIIVRNWPDVLGDYELKGVQVSSTAPIPDYVSSGAMEKFDRSILIHPSGSLDPGRVNALQKAGLTPTVRTETGVQLFAPGGGAACSGVSVLATVHADHEVWWADRLAESVEAEIEQILQKLPEDRKRGLDGLEFRIKGIEEMKDGIVHEERTRARIAIEGMSFDRNYDPRPMLAALARANLAVSSARRG